MRNRTILIAIFTTATVFACKSKKDDPAGADPGSAMTATGSSAAGGESKAKPTAINEKPKVVFKETDCDRLAAELMTMLNASRGDVTATNAWEKDHPDDKLAFQTATLADMQAAVSPSMERCKNTPAFQKAIAKLD